jgi:hypothetical protein
MPIGIFLLVIAKSSNPTGVTLQNEISDFAKRGTIDTVVVVVNSK